MFKLLGVISLSAAATIAAVGHQQHPDEAVRILVAALSHARTIVPEGKLQVDPQKFKGDRRWLYAAASELQAGYGPGTDVVDCWPVGGCKPTGDFKGIIEVLDLSRPSADSAIVTMDTIKFEAEGGPVYSLITYIHLKRGDDNEWRIAAVVRGAET